MVAILAETSASASKLFQMTLGRFGAFRLEIAIKPKIPLVYFLPPAFSKKIRIRGNSRTIDAEIDSQNFPRGGNLRSIDGYNNIE